MASLKPISFRILPVTRAQLDDLKLVYGPNQTVIFQTLVREEWERRADEIKKKKRAKPKV